MDLFCLISSRVRLMHLPVCGGIMAVGAFESMRQAARFFETAHRAIFRNGLSGNSRRSLAHRFIWMSEMKALGVTSESSFMSRQKVRSLMFKEAAIFAILYSPAVIASSVAILTSSIVSCLAIFNRF